MNKGRVAASGPPERLIAESGLAARVVLPRTVLWNVGTEEFEGLTGVAHVRTTGTSFYVYGDANIVATVADFLSDTGVSPGVIETRPVNLDDVYFLSVGSDGLRVGRK